MPATDLTLETPIDGSEDELPDEVLAELEAETAPEPGEIEQMRDESNAIIRDLLLNAHPDAIPELVHGETLTELLDSVLSAEQIFRKVAEVIDARRAAVPPPHVPAGGMSPIRDLDHATPDTLIRTALVSRQSSVASGQ